MLRKPEKALKNAIKDWHLIVFVSVMVFIDVIFLTIYTLLEALLDNFGILRVPNKETPSDISGVRWNPRVGVGVKNIHIRCYHTAVTTQLCLQFFSL